MRRLWGVWMLAFLGCRSEPEPVEPLDPVGLPTPPTFALEPAPDGSVRMYLQVRDAPAGRNEGAEVCTSFGCATTDVDGWAEIFVPEQGVFSFSVEPVGFIPTLHTVSPQADGTVVQEAFLEVDDWPSGLGAFDPGTAHVWGWNEGPPLMPTMTPDLGGPPAYIEPMAGWQVDADATEAGIAWTWSGIDVDTETVQVSATDGFGACGGADDSWQDPDSDSLEVELRRGFVSVVRVLCD